MPESAESLVARIANATQPGFRFRLVARGLARGMIWTDGQLPPDSPQFVPTLSGDLLSYGLSLIGAGLRLRLLAPGHPAIARAFERGGEAIEAVVRNGDPAWPERGFYTMIAAAAYHLGRFSARAFSLLAGELQTLNLSPAERALVLVMRRDLPALRVAIRAYAGDGGGFDNALAMALVVGAADLAIEGALQLSLDALFHRALASFDAALETGDEALLVQALGFLAEGIAAAADADSVPFWWSFTIAWHLLEDLWGHSLHVRLPRPANDPAGSRWSVLRQLFISLLLRRPTAEIDLWPSQIEAAARALDQTDDLVVALPTSAGKTRIAELCILRALALEQRVVFVTPLRALSAQTERTLRQTFGPMGFTVSSLYGSSGATGDDVDSLGNRHIVVSTPEKLDFALRNNPDLLADVGLIVLDEAHSIGAGEREIRYEVLVQRLLRRDDAAHRRIVCLSAILPQGEQLQDFVAWIRQDQPGAPISCDWRPTRQRFGEVGISNDRIRLSFKVEEEQPYVDPFVEPTPPHGQRKTNFPKHENPELALAAAWRLVRDGRSVLIYCPQRSSVESLAKAALKCQRDGYLPSLFEADPAVLHDALTIGREWLGDNHPAVQCLGIGVAVHHGQLPRPFQRAVERLLRQRHLKITIASPTLAQGLNLSATTVLFYSLYRSGKAILAEEFANVAGRAGRAFVDVEGQVIGVVQNPRQREEWGKLVGAKGMRNLRSGLLQLVTSLCGMLANRVGAGVEQLVEYVLNNAGAWDAPAATEFDEDLPERWQTQLACLDSALLSLVRHDAPADAIAQTLDEALHSSLWQRSAQRDSEQMRALTRAFLLGRAGFIWTNSTPAQRKGYFFAGLSFDTGRYLDAHAAELNASLLAADAALQAGDIEAATAALVRFGTIVFGIAPFEPDELPENWGLILRAWLSGNSMMDLAGGQEIELQKFIENVLVYRLVWALEAVRVRANAAGDAEENIHAGRAALAVETGTPTIEAALLIQSGLPSRVAALAALRDCPGAFTNLAGLRAWLFSPPVFVRSSAGDWPTPDTASLWRAFADSFRATARTRWEVRPFAFAVRWTDRPPAPGAVVRVVHDAATARTTVFSSDWIALGEVQPPLKAHPSGVFRARVAADGSGIGGDYTGPNDLEQSA